MEQEVEWQVALEMKGGKRSDVAQSCSEGNPGRVHQDHVVTL